MLEPRPVTRPLLELDGIRKVFELERRVLHRLAGRTRPLIAVKDATLSVKPGDVLGLVGESGCGKSTLAQLILRLEPVTAGTIRFDGTDITHLDTRGLKPFRRRIQMVFQDTNASLNPRKSICRTITESLTLAGDDPGRAAGLMAEVGLPSNYLGRYPHELSGGQRQRVGIARALAMQPDLLVLDEPVSSLDVSLQAQIMRLLIDLKERRGLTMIFISHDLALVHHLCSHVAVMRAGEIVERGKPADVLFHPAHPYTQALLAAVPGRKNAA